MQLLGDLGGETRTNRVIHCLQFGDVHMGISLQCVDVLGDEKFIHRAIGDIHWDLGLAYILVRMLIDDSVDERQTKTLPCALGDIRAILEAEDSANMTRGGEGEILVYR